MKVINYYVFENCISLKEIDLHQQINIINARAFFGCKNLVSINLTETITYFGGNIFGDCEKLININVFVSSIENFYLWMENIDLNYYIFNNNTNIETLRIFICNELKIIFYKTGTYERVNGQHSLNKLSLTQKQTICFLLQKIGRFSICLGI